MTVADNLQTLINAKADMKSAIESKGVEVTGGLTTYADAISKIETENIIINGDGIDYTLLGWNTKDSIAQNIIDAETRDSDIQVSQEVLEYYKNGFPGYDINNFWDSQWESFRENIVYMPAVRFDNGVSLKNMFNGSSPLRVFPPSRASISNLQGTFYMCNNLESVGLLECGNTYTIRDMFWKNYNLRHLGGFNNLGNNIDTLSTLANGTLYFKDSLKLSKESLLNVFNTIGTKGPRAEQLTIYLNEIHLALLTDEDIAIATNKGWTVTS